MPMKLSLRTRRRLLMRYIGERLAFSSERVAGAHDRGDASTLEAP